jgi:hypothetical protein
MTFDLAKILQSKHEFRQRLAARPIAEKLAMLDALRENEVNLDTPAAVLGPWVTFDPKKERFVNDHAKQANALAHREYRQPFVVPKIA